MINLLLHGMFRVTPQVLAIIAELHSGPKGRRAEPHRFRTNIENKKTMRLSSHGHRGKRHGLRAHRSTYRVAQNGGHTPEKA